MTRKDKIRNDSNRGTIKIERLGMKMREGRLRWCGHVMRRNQKYVERAVMEMELLGKRKRETEEKISGYSEGEYGEVGAKEMDARNRKLWRNIIPCGNP